MDDHLRSPQIIKMQAKHIEDLAAIEKLCFSKPWSYESLAEELSNPLAVFFVAEQDGRAVAYAGMHHIIDEGYITNIAVHPDFRHQGLATELVHTLDSYANDNGLALLTLEVRCSNTAAIGIYKREGFDEEGVRKGFYEGPKEDGLIMTKYF
jgi:[ribosomal protein S18]-alanine N-acetyltransferase